MNTPHPLPILVALGLSACAAPRPAVPPMPVEVAPSRLEVAAAPPVVALNGEAPTDMIARLHAENLEMSWKNAERLLRVIGVGSPGLSPDILAMGMLGPSVGSVVDRTGQVDLAFFGTDFERLAVSIPVAVEMVPRLGQMFTLHPQRGLLRITGTPGDEDSDSSSLGACAFVGIEDEARARVVCASDDELLEAAGLYLGRTVTREAPDGDVRLELQSGQLFAQIADEASDGNTNDWAEAAGEQWAISFFRDIERLSLVGSWGKTDIEAEAVLGFRQNPSVLSRAISARVPLQSESAASFARLPKDSAVAMHGHAANAQALAPLRDEFLKTFRGEMVEDGYDSALLDTFNANVSSLFFTGGSYAFAYGIDRAAAEKAVAAYKKDSKKPANRAAAYRSLRGWAMFAVDEPTERWTRGIEEIVRVGNELDRKRLGGAASVTTADRMSTTMNVAALPAALPKGSLHIEIKSRPITKDAAPAYTTHLYVVPDGGRTWIGLGEDEAPMLVRLRAAREGITEQTIAGVPELANAASQGSVAAGFASIAGVTLWFLDDDHDAALEKAVEEIESLSTLPARGEGIIPWQIVSEEAQNGGGQVRMKARLSLPVLGDIAEMARR